MTAAADGRRPTIAFFIPALGMGGAERQLLTLSNALDKREWNVIVAQRPGEPSEWAGDAAVVNRGPRYRFVPGLRAFLERNRVDVLHAYLLPAQVDGVLARAGGWKGHLVIGVRDALPLWPVGNLARLTGSAVVFGCRWWVDRYVFNSRCGGSMKRPLVAARQRVVIANGIDCDRFRPDPTAAANLRRALGLGADAVIVGCVANVTGYKDYPTFVAAAARVVAARSDVHFVAVGDDRGATADRVRAQAQRARVQDRIHFLGSRTDVERIVPGFDLYCSSSATEGFPNAVAEAMACGVPCVVTDVGDSAFLIGDTGLAVPRRNAAALAEAILQGAAWSNAERRTRGEAARARIIDCFSIDRMVAAHEALYRTLLSHRSVAPTDASCTEPA